MNQKDIECLEQLLIQVGDELAKSQQNKWIRDNLDYDYVIKNLDAVARTLRLNKSKILAAHCQFRAAK